MAASDGTLYLYTSLTAGSSHIITATSRLETILKANKIPFRAIDVATDDAARRLWGRYSKGRKLPGLVKYRTIIGDLEQIEEWNEYGELKMEIGAVTDPDDFSSGTTTENKPIVDKPSTGAVEIPKPTPVATTTTTTTTTTTSKSGSPHIQIQNPPVTETKEDQRTLALRLAGEEAAAKAKQSARAKLGTKPATTEGDGKAPPSANPKAKGTEPVEGTVGKPNPKDPANPLSEEQPTVSSASENREQSSPPVSPEGSRRSVAPEIVAPLKRPSLADECAAVSSGNLHADNAEALGLIDHHRGSIISATTKDEQEQVKKDIRASITEAPQEGDIQELRNTAAGKDSNTIVEDEEEKEEERNPQEQDPKDATKAGVSVED